MTAGAMSAVRSERSPIRSSPIWPRPGKPAREVRAHATVTRVLTNAAGSKAVNVGMVVGRMPITGIPLPLMSSGGSNTWSIFLMLGLVNSVRLRRFVN